MTSALPDPDAFGSGADAGPSDDWGVGMADASDHGGHWTPPVDAGDYVDTSAPIAPDPWPDSVDHPAHDHAVLAHVDDPTPLDDIDDHAGTMADDMDHLG